MHARSGLCSIAAVAAIASLAISCSFVTIGTGLSKSFAVSTSRIVDHQTASVQGLTASRVLRARKKLRIAYWRTAFGGHLTSGISGMDAFFGGKGIFVLGGPDGLSVDEMTNDLTFLDYVEDTTARYLAEHAGTNVVMWSWGNQLSAVEDSFVYRYLQRMSELETMFPTVAFVYMTGCADGAGEEGDASRRNRIIREYCEANRKWLYDFYDIQCYDPDGAYYGDRLMTSGCNYDADGDGIVGQTGDDPPLPIFPDRNWAIDWQGTHTQGADWWDCGAAHSQPVDANRKAAAAWQLWCAIADSQ
jgi:hypothetical protein